MHLTGIHFVDDTKNIKLFNKSMSAKYKNDVHLD